MNDVAKMSNRTADVLFGAPAVVGELGELTGLVRRIAAALNEVDVTDAMAFAARGVVPAAIEPHGLLPYPTDFAFPMPAWGEADYSVPAPPPSGIPA